LKNSRDLHHSPDKELENILKLALQMGLNDTLLGPTPRKTLHEYLGIDVVEEHERRERFKKQEEDDKRRLAREAEKIAAEQRKKDREAERIAEEKRRQAEAKVQLPQKNSDIPTTPSRATKRSHPDAFEETGQANTPSKRPAMEPPKTPGPTKHIQALQEQLAAEKKAKELAEEAAVKANQRVEEELKKRKQAEEKAETERVKRARIEGSIARQTALPSLVPVAPAQPTLTAAQIEQARTQAAISSMDGW